MHLEACFDQEDHDHDGDDDDDGDDDGGDGDAKTRDPKADLILCIFRSSEIFFYTNTFYTPVRYFFIQMLFALQ